MRGDVFIDSRRMGAMYYRIVSQCVRSLKNVDVWLDRAEALAADKKFDVDVLMTSRLAPDMQPFIYQVQSACDYVKGAAGWLSGQSPPQHADNERTIADVRERIQKTVAFAESIEETQYAGAGERMVRMSWAGGKNITAPNYVLQITVPNVYFHLSTAYAILRHNGVDVGKMVFLGRISWADA
jgi:hypothetical protein